MTTDSVALLREYVIERLQAKHPIDLEFLGYTNLEFKPPYYVVNILQETK